MLFTRRLVLGTALLALAACAASTPDDMAAKRSMINADADAAWSKLLAENPAAKTLSAEAKGVAIFPDIIKGGLGIGAETGDGVLRVGGKDVAYYNTSAASIGLQIGGQSYSQVLMFLTDEALQGFQDSSGWEAGADGTITVLQTGASGSIDTTNIADPVVGFVFGESGLMAGASLAGSKYTKLDL